MNIWFPKVIIILIMTVQVLFFDVFSEKDPHLNAVKECYIRTFLFRDTSLCQHKETICMNLEFEMFSIFFFLKVLYFFQYFITYVLFYITL